MIKAAVFDMDGTLLNTIEDIADAVNFALAENGHPTFSLEEIRQKVGLGMYTLIDRVMPPEASNNAAMYSTVIKGYQTYYSKHKTNKTVPYEGILEVVSRLDKLGIKMGILSNKPDAESKAMAAYFFPEISVVFGQREGIPLKPNPEALLELLEVLEVDPSETVYIGDTDVDMEVGQAAGTRVVGVTWGFRPGAELKAAGAEHLVDHPKELIPLLESL